MKKIILGMSLLLAAAALFVTIGVKRYMKHQQSLDELNAVVQRTMNGKDYIKNCAVAVMNGDGSFYVSTAAGWADQGENREMSEETPYFQASITKMYTAVIIMKLQEEGRLNLADTIDTYLPSSIVTGLNVIDGVDHSHKVTIEHLISHRSGIADYYSDRDSRGKVFYELCKEEPNRQWTVMETIDYAKDNLSAKFIPGSQGAYSDTNYQLLGLIIEKICGEDLASVYSKHIFTPLEMNHTWLVNHSNPMETSGSPAQIMDENEDVTHLRSNGSYWADGGIISTLGDSITFLHSLRTGKLLSEESLTMMHQFKDIEYPLTYGYGTMGLMKLGLGSTWGHLGSSGSFLAYNEDGDIYIAGTINAVGNHRVVSDLMNSLFFYGRTQTKDS